MVQSGGGGAGEREAVSCLAESVPPLISWLVGKFESVAILYLLSLLLIVPLLSTCLLVDCPGSLSWQRKGGGRICLALSPSLAIYTPYSFLIYRINEKDQEKVYCSDAERSLI